MLNIRNPINSQTTPNQDDEQTVSIILCSERVERVEDELACLEFAIHFKLRILSTEGNNNMSITPTFDISICWIELSHSLRDWFVSSLMLPKIKRSVLRQIQSSNDVCRYTISILRQAEFIFELSSFIEWLVYYEALGCIFSWITNVFDVEQQVNPHRQNHDSLNVGFRLPFRWMLAALLTQFQWM